MNIYEIEKEIVNFYISLGIDNTIIYTLILSMFIIHDLYEIKNIDVNENIFKILFTKKYEEEFKQSIALSRYGMISRIIGAIFTVIVIVCLKIYSLFNDV